MTIQTTHKLLLLPIQKKDINALETSSILTTETYYLSQFEHTNYPNRKSLLHIVSLHIRITTTHKKRSPQYTLLLKKIASELKTTHNTSIFPFLTRSIDLEQSLKPCLKDNPIIKSKCDQSIQGWKKQEWNFSRKKFITYNDNHGKRHNITKQVIYTKQDSESSKKYSKDICFDATTGEFMYPELMDLDHMDPWSNICERVQETIKFINTCPLNIKTKLCKEIVKRFPDYFIYKQHLSGIELKPTQYLGMCLFNYDQNLTSMNHNVNNKKGNTQVCQWIQAHIEGFAEKIAMQPNMKLEDLIDTDDFILRLSRNPQLVKDIYRGKGLGKAIYLQSLYNYDETLGPRKLTFIENIKHFRMIQLTQRLLKMIRLTDTQRNQIQDAIDRYSKNIQSYGKQQRNTLRHTLLNICNQTDIKADNTHQNTAHHCELPLLVLSEDETTFFSLKRENSNTSIEDNL